MSIRLLKSSCTKDHYFKQNQIGPNYKGAMIDEDWNESEHPKKDLHGYDFVVKVYMDLTLINLLDRYN